MNIEQVEVFESGYSHRNQLHHRLKIVKGLLQTAKRSLTQDYLDQLWGILSASSINIDSEILCTWLNEMIVAELLPAELLIKLYQESICNTSSFKTLQKQGFQLIRAMFLLVN